MKLNLNLLAAGGAAALSFAAVPASADIVFCNGGGCASQGETVHLSGDDGSAGSEGGANVVVGDLQSGLIDVLISSNEAISTTSDGFGQAWIVANDFVGGSPGDPVESGGFNTLTFALESGYWFRSLEFRLSPTDTTRTGPAPAWNISFSGLDQNGDEFTDTFSNLGANEFFNAVAINGQRLTSVTFTTTNDMARAAQIRIGGAAPVGVIPEPGAWALMILGFGGAGAMLRRRRRSPVLA